MMHAIIPSRVIKSIQRTTSLARHTIHTVDLGKMTSTKGARTLKVLVGLPILLGGVVFTVLLWQSYKRAEVTRRWPAVEALVVSSRLMTERATPHSPLSYRADVQYRYTWEGNTYEGTRIQRVQGPSSNRDKPERQLDRYPAGKMTTCYVNPSNPEQAVLEHATRAALYSIWFPLLFVAGGAGIIWSALRAKKEA